MPARHLPRLWLMTDERMGEGLWAALEHMPRGQGVVFRHHGVAGRRALFDRVRVVARRRRLMLVVAGSPRLAAAWGADGAHGRHPHRRSGRPLIRTAPCHSRRELIAARHAALRFVSPAFPTRSHPGTRALGPVRLGLMTCGETGLVALGGMSPARARMLRPLGINRWAAIDAFLR